MLKRVNVSDEELRRIYRNALTPLQSIAAGIFDEALKVYGRKWPDFHIGNACKVCGDTRVLETEDGRYAQCVCALSSRRPRATTNSTELERITRPLGEPPEQLWTTQQQAADIVERWILRTDKKPPKIVVFSGLTGTGKTTLARWFVSKYKPFAAFVPSMSFRGILKSEQWDEVIDLVGRIPLIVLDDVGADTVGGAEFLRNAVFQILEVRASLMAGAALTIVTTNLDAASIADVFGERVLSRLSIKRGAAWVVFGKDKIIAKEAQG